MGRIPEIATLITEVLEELSELGDRRVHFSRTQKALPLNLRTSLLIWDIDEIKTALITRISTTTIRQRFNILVKCTVSSDRFYEVYDNIEYNLLVQTTRSNESDILSVLGVTKAKKKWEPRLFSNSNFTVQYEFYIPIIYAIEVVNEDLVEIDEFIYTVMTGSDSNLETSSEIGIEVGSSENTNSGTSGDNIN